MMTDPISDMLTRLRNANRIHKKNVAMPASRMKVGIAQILKDEGYIHDYKVEAARPSSQLTISLKYGQDGEMVILSLDSGIYFGLNEVGTRIWLLLREHAALAKVVDLMLAEYDVPRDALESDVLRLAQQLSAHGLARIRRQSGEIAD
jgi:ribosomal protein S8